MKREMLRKVFFAGLMAGVLSFSEGFAQTEVSDEELKSYALVMDSIDVLKEEMGVKYNDRIKSEELMDGGRRFKEIDDANGDEAKLAAANVTAEELAAYQGIKAYYDSLISDFKATYPELIKSDLLGAATYNKVKKALADAEVKARYEAILAERKKETTTEETATAGQ